MIIVPRDQSAYEREDPKNFLNTISYGPAFRLAFLEESFKLYLKILSLNATTPRGENVSLSDICFKPLYPENQNCAVYSIFNYFQVSLFHVV